MILFYPRGKTDIVGIIISRFENIIYKNITMDIPEINFLCIHSELRNMHLGPYLISVMTKIMCEDYNTSCAYYTISFPIESKPLFET
jgi:hypothetical protein